MVVVDGAGMGWGGVQKGVNTYLLYGHHTHHPLIDGGPQHSGVPTEVHSGSMDSLLSIVPVVTVGELVLMDGCRWLLPVL